MCVYELVHIAVSWLFHRHITFFNICWRSVVLRYFFAVELSYPRYLFCLFPLVFISIRIVKANVEFSHSLQMLNYSWNNIIIKIKNTFTFVLCTSLITPKGRVCQTNVFGVYKNDTCWTESMIFATFGISIFDMCLIFGLSLMLTYLFLFSIYCIYFHTADIYSR